MNVFSGPSKPRDRAYYTRLYKWLQTEGVGQLNSYLRRIDLSNFDWQRSMETPARTTMIENNRSETETLFHLLRENPPFAAMTFAQIIDEMGKLSERDHFGTSIDESQLQKLLQHHAEHWQQIKIDGKKPRPWILNPSVDLNSAKVREAVQKCSQQ